ncbi:hypothetical protein N0V94_006494 [Neodidymelliopsis sp. IMI 364377]|nr:hypothetical protein N0V94_006494 [Neodidymelliopsis sp. IMI 364377]
MRSSIILALATAASAIDIEWFGEAHCRNGYGLRCTGVNPHGCCSGQRSDGWAAVQFSNIPSNWDLLTDGYAGEGCNTNSLVNEFRSNGNAFSCHGDNRHYKSAAYRFYGKKKRASRVDTRDAPAEDCVKPDELFLADGTTYAISGLTDAQVGDLTATHADLPADYQALKIE